MSAGVTPARAPRRRGSALIVVLIVAALTAPAGTTSAPLRDAKRQDMVFQGTDAKTIEFTVSRPSTLRWAAPGGLFQVFPDGSTAGFVNSQTSSGASYLPPRRYVLSVNAIGSWTVRIAPGVEHPSRISSGVIGFRGNGGRSLPPFRITRARALYWRASRGGVLIFASGVSKPIVNSVGARGTSRIKRGRYSLTVNARGPWTIYWRSQP